MSPDGRKALGAYFPSKESKLSSTDVLTWS